MPSDRVIMRFMRGLGFQVTTEQFTAMLIYHVQVPTFRSSRKILKLKKIYLEEIGRRFGYTNIPLVLPHKESKAFAVTSCIYYAAD